MYQQLKVENAHQCLQKA